MLIDVLAQVRNVMPSVFDAIGDVEIDIYQVGFEADEFDGQTLIESKVNSNPIPAQMSVRNARTDEGGRWQSYQQTVLRFACKQTNGEVLPFDLKLTDKIYSRKSDLSPAREFKITSIGWYKGKIGIAYEIAGEFDIREGQRIEDDE